MYDGLCIRARTDANIVTFDRTDESFGHSIALRTFDWRRSRFEADVASGVSRDLVNASYTLGTKRTEAIWHVIFPAALPGILDTLRVTMGWAWTYLVVAELVAANSGLGYLSLKAMRGFQVDTIFLAVALIGILGAQPSAWFKAGGGGDEIPALLAAAAAVRTASSRSAQRWSGTPASTTPARSAARRISRR